jgi:hypothetical protein
MPRKSIGERPMTDAERQARYRAMHAAGAPVIGCVGRAIIAAGHDAGTMLSPSSRTYSLSIVRGWNRCRTTCKSARPLRRYEQSVTLISRNCRQSTRRAASDGIDA